MKYMSIDDLIIEFFKKLNEINPEEKSPCPVCKQDEENVISLIYPTTNNKNKKIRVSEQEARLAFINHLEEHNKGTDEKYYCSIETPTERKYILSKDGKTLKYPQIDENGRSAAFDLTLYKKVNGTYKVCSHIEFKNKSDGIAKDFLKLFKDSVVDKGTDTNYFVHILSSTNKNSWDSLLEKYKEAAECLNKNGNANFKERNKVSIYIISLWHHKGREEGEIKCYRIKDLTVKGIKNLKPEKFKEDMLKSPEKLNKIDDRELIDKTD